ncbi:MAG TPA: CoA pyrophosphatase [Gemmatimonadaceae bacterium]|nr:CoA pyrophosphatase [Gemmatimonadaceae bacterium]
MNELENLRNHPVIARLEQRLENHEAVEVYEPGVRRAAVALMLRLGELNEPEMFFIQRAHYETDPWSGQVAFPGGREESADESLAHTAIRETFEETGIDIASCGKVIGQLDDLRPRVVRLPAVIVRPFVVLIGSHPEPILSDEVAATFWVPLASLNDDTGWRDTIVTAGGLEFTRRAFHHGEFVVWGMTERILSSFLELSK